MNPVKPYLRNYYCEPSNHCMILGYPTLGVCLSSAKKRVERIFYSKHPPRVITPPVHEVKNRAGRVVGENVPPPYMFIGMFEGSANNGGDSAQLVVVWFQDSAQINPEAALAEAEANWTSAEDVFW